jgi:hypothetical protein
MKAVFVPRPYRYVGNNSVLFYNFIRVADRVLDISRRMEVAVDIGSGRGFVTRYWYRSTSWSVKLNTVCFAELLYTRKVGVLSNVGHLSFMFSDTWRIIQSEEWLQWKCHQVPVLSHLDVKATARYSIYDKMRDIPIVNFHSTLYESWRRSVLFIF